MSRPKWRTFSLEKGPFLRGNESSNHQFSGDIIYLVSFQGGVIHHNHFFLDASKISVVAPYCTNDLIVLCLEIELFVIFLNVFPTCR